MSKPGQPLPAGGHRREVAAIIEIEHTAVSPFIVRLLVSFFVAAIVIVPVAEVAVARVRPDESVATAWTHLSRVPDEVRAYFAGAAHSSLWQRIVSTNRIVLTGLSGFERSLENESFIGRSLRPPAQLLMTRWLGAGNERVYPGHDGWLFYRQDVEHVTGPGFLDPARIRQRIAAAPEWTDPPQPDPRVAIAAFNRDLVARGITLVVVPTPVKPAVHPEMLARTYADVDGVLQNPSYRAFVDELERGGVRVFDPTEALAAMRGAGPQYLATDTHWRPETMESVATLLAEYVTAHVSLPVAEDPGYRIDRVHINNIGDVARMLDLPRDTSLVEPEEVWLRRVLGPDGSSWRSSRDADVLVLGDSFSNIYSLESMGWGTSAGFIEQLGYALRRPIDRLVQNDQGSFATRAMVQRDPARLQGKRVLIYQFAMRELTEGDWKVLKLP